MSEINDNILKEHKCGKMRVLFLRKKTLIAIFLCIAVLGFGIFGGIRLASITTVSPLNKPVIVIDAGHGGIDNGVVGPAGTKESDFNLAMSLELAQFLNDAGFKVVMTRIDENGLYGDSMDNFKRRDMEARKKVITDNNPDFVVSIHANKFPGDSRRGAQVFFDEFSESGKALAGDIQTGLNSLNKEYVGRSFDALAGDYYMLKCTQNPSVIVECGFLSNAEDEKLLCNAEYRKELGFAIYSGIVAYLASVSPTQSGN